MGLGLYGFTFLIRVVADRVTLPRGAIEDYSSSEASIAAIASTLIEHKVPEQGWLL